MEEVIFLLQTLSIPLKIFTISLTSLKEKALLVDRKKLICLLPTKKKQQQKGCKKYISTRALSISEIFIKIVIAQLTKLRLFQICITLNSIETYRNN